jgi:hypothetical protein
MSYREFSDESGRNWGVWFVSPSAAERRKDNRREVRIASISGGERRVVADRRQHPSRARSAVAPGFEHGWLCFASDDGLKRRLIPVPHNWEQADADHLREWLSQAVDSSKCRPL